MRIFLSLTHCIVDHLTEHSLEQNARLFCEANNGALGGTRLKLEEILCIRLNRQDISLLVLRRQQSWTMQGNALYSDVTVHLDSHTAILGISRPTYGLKSQQEVN